MKSGIEERDERRKIKCLRGEKCHHYLDSPQVCIAFICRNGPPC